MGKARRKRGRPKEVKAARRHPSLWISSQEAISQSQAACLHFHPELRLSGARQRERNVRLQLLGLSRRHAVSHFLAHNFCHARPESPPPISFSLAHTHSHLHFLCLSPPPLTRTFFLSHTRARATQQSQKPHWKPRGGSVWLSWRQAISSSKLHRAFSAHLSLLFSLSLPPLSFYCHHLSVCVSFFFFRSPTSPTPTQGQIPSLSCLGKAEGGCWCVSVWCV